MIARTDVSGSRVTLDYSDLLRTAKVAFVRSAERVSKNLDEAMTAVREDKGTLLGLKAEWIQGDAENLVVAGRTLAALLAAPTRERVTVVGFKEESD